AGGLVGGRRRRALPSSCLRRSRAGYVTGHRSWPDARAQFRDRVDRESRPRRLARYIRRPFREQLGKWALTPRDPVRSVRPLDLRPLNVPTSDGPTMPRSGRRGMADARLGPERWWSRPGRNRDRRSGASDTEVTPLVFF